VKTRYEIARKCTSDDREWWGAFDTVSAQELADAGYLVGAPAKSHNPPGNPPLPWCTLLNRSGTTIRDGVRIRQLPGRTH